jgi:hypothetical protein
MSCEYPYYKRGGILSLFLKREWPYALNEKNNTKKHKKKTLKPKVQNKKS